MFGYVSQHEFDAEHELRLKAEAAAEEARQVASHAFATIESERIAHRAQMADLLDRLLPKPKDPTPGFGVPGIAAGLSSDELRKIPAVGGRGLRERNAAVRDAETREKAAETEADGASRRATLTPEEQALVDRQMQN